MVADTAIVHGDVEAMTVIVVGRVTGDVRAKKAAEIRSKAVIGGGVRAREVYIAVGAKIGGEILAAGSKGPLAFQEQREGTPVIKAENQ